jgi:hypothetical protein
MTKELLFSITKNDFEIQTFRSGGKGGQNQNKVESGVRIIHKESGSRGESRTERSQSQNKKIAFKRLIESKEFKSWFKFKTALILKNVKDIEKYLDNSLKEENLKVEIREDGKWVKEK